LRAALLVCALFCLQGGAFAQQKGEPGKFDFYLLNVVPSTEFCAIADVGPGCKTRDGFVLHGLWAQRFDGTYPVFCSNRPGPKHPERNLDLTPDLTLLKHEWEKHGTCTTLTAEAFFAAERRAYTALVVPKKFVEADTTLTLAPSEILGAFYQANPRVPAGGLILWCSKGKLTSVSVCLSKELDPVVCQGLKSCGDTEVQVGPVRQ
jgi:ribonuclease T2